jgi:hypothetical protein
VIAKKPRRADGGDGGMGHEIQLHAKYLSS